MFVYFSVFLHSGFGPTPSSLTLLFCISHVISYVLCWKPVWVLWTDEFCISHSCGLCCNSLESVAFHYICISVNLINSLYTFLSHCSLLFLQLHRIFTRFVWVQRFLFLLCRLLRKCLSWIRSLPSSLGDWWPIKQARESDRKCYVWRLYLRLKWHFIGL